MKKNFLTLLVWTLILCGAGEEAMAKSVLKESVSTQAGAKQGEGHHKGKRSLKSTLSQAPGGGSSKPGKTHKALAASR